MSLLRTASRAYIATRVVGSTHRRQQQRWAEQEAAAPHHAAPQHTAPAAPAQTMLEQLTQLGQLRDAGVLTEAEFDTQKQRILAAN